MQSSPVPASLSITHRALGGALGQACKNKQLPDYFAVELCFEPAAEVRPAARASLQPAAEAPPTSRRAQGAEGERQLAALSELEGRAVGGDDASSHETDDEAGGGDDHEIDDDDDDYELTRTHSLKPGQTAKDGMIAQDQWM